MAANELGKAAMELGGGAMAAYLLGEMLDYFGRSNEAVAILESAHPVGDEEVAVIAMARSDAMFWGQARTDDAISVSAEAEATVTLEPWTSSLRAQRAKLLAFARRYPEAATLAEPLLDHPSARVVADASIPAALAAVHSGATRRSVEIARRGLATRQGLDDVLQVTGIEVHRSHLMTNLSEAGMIAEALEMCRREHAAGVAANSVAAMVWYGLALSRLELLAGQTDVALRLAVEADHITSTINVSGFRLSLTFEALAQAYRGDGRSAAATIERMDAAPPATILTFVVEESRARAWQIAASGEVHRACLALLATADEAASCRQRTHEAQALHDIVRIGEAPLAIDRLEALAEVIDGSLHAARVEHARGLIAGDAAGISKVADAFEAMSATLLAAEAASQAAELLRSAGDRRTLVAASRRAHELRQLCPGAATPALLTAETVVPLTAREREVALMAATGTSSREVAERLICSPRTVETHLQNAYQKLGVTTRSGLADALGVPRP